MHIIVLENCGGLVGLADYGGGGGECECSLYVCMYSLLV